MDRTKQVMKRLKPKVKAFGFDPELVERFAAQIAKKLDLDDEASEEDVNTAIDNEIEVVLPLMPIVQSYTSRRINDALKKNGDGNDNNDEDGDEDDDSSSQQPRRKPGRPPKKDDEEPAWFKVYREKQEERFAAIEGQRTTDSRKSKLEAILKDSGTFGKQIIKGFSKMKFDTDDEFDEYFSEVEDDLNAYNQELADKGLGGTPPGAGNGGKGGSELPELTDAEIDDIVAAM